mmetsp:Transcript_39445/g.118432  ORF Transcript_39445/g.118432 Transcript_39445/m.118432 type:complete len:188 (-) Transcript_39445:187-750(-)|eukprot:CAMPEP_0113535442 /NCGR_PEP_ID=MMETSP0015_2-20120614/5712_1 /TAXON_ID=2838 /ORGANISM="Odontella" /LENGTH=187 /DNA_ID=CAMNT_0000434705 /DNA_START=219 /DNA_END=782 /DNA_ORIENTATION=+ /assembly_acc=CAM_ASM_000160
MRVVILPGMGCTPVKSSNWYSWFQDEMGKRRHVTECILRDFPDPYGCRESIWVPFVQKDIGLDSDTVIVGHSSGAACAMRLLESDDVPKMRGAILVSAAHTDLGDESERRSEYFNRPWSFDKMKTGADIIHQFHAPDDHLIPVSEARFVAEKLEGDNFEYTELPGKSHFFHPWQEILEVMDNKFASL